MDLKEYLFCFEELCAYELLKNIPIYLIFTKDDLFKEKLKNINLNVSFHEFIKENSNYSNAIDYIKEKFLERNNYEVVDFTSGKKALAWYEENSPDIVLCDLRLEDIGGLDILQKMKSSNPALPFLVITGYSDVRTAVEIMRHGAYDYITKPLFPDEILVTIKQALANGEGRQVNCAQRATASSRLFFALSG